MNESIDSIRNELECLRSEQRAISFAIDLASKHLEDLQQRGRELTKALTKTQEELIEAMKGRAWI